MRKLVAAGLAASLTCAALLPAARALAQAADPFPEVPIPASPKRSYAWAILTMATGAGLIGGSFGFSDTANRRYAEYLRATDPGRISDLYDQAITLDRLSTGSLVTGEALIAAGLYLAFLRRPEVSRLGLTLGPSRCGVLLRY
ncbi:MAG TPA: hypothetical protein VGK89_14940 [Candidatus Eisenbacteria bacterium]|jgi:hypothetical protein